MKVAWALVMVAAAGACSGGATRVAMDAGVDADPDGGMMPDADPLADTDGDGVLDTVDVCPTVADPAQVDLDGDHIGWMCDAIESTTIPFTGELGGMPLAVRHHTMGAALSYACVNGMCMHASFSVGPGGVSRATGQTDAWLNGVPVRGFVGAENRVLWSLADGVLGDQDASSDTFTPRKTGGILGSSGDGTARYERDQLLVLSSEARDSSINTYDLLAPQPNGDVLTIATSSRPYDKPTIVGTNPARLVFGVTDPGNRSVREFVPGSNTSQPIVVDGTPLSNADLVQSMTRPTIGGMFGFCVEKAGKTYYVETVSEQLRAYEAPIPSCGFAQQTKDLRLTLISGVGNAFVVVNGVIHPLLISGALELIGTGVPAVISKRRENSSYYDVHVVDAAGALHQLVSDGVASKVSRAGDTLHFLSMRGGTTITLVRYRNGTFTEIPVPAIPDHEHWEVFTTKEGAALLSTISRALVWPSQSAVATQVDFDNIDVLVRDSATFFVASHNDPRSQPALYSYAEVGGVPQYTAHTPEVLQNVSFTMVLAPLGYSLPYRSDQLPLTDWFMYAKNGDCRLVWPMVTGTTITLLGNLPCAGGASIRGVTPSGTSVLELYGSVSPQQLYLLDGTTLTKVVEGRYLSYLYAAPESPVLMGWAGQDVGGNRFLCSASHPDRCWSTPGDPRIWGPIVPAQPDELHVLFVTNANSAMSITSLRTFGPGNRAQPL